MHACWGTMWQPPTIRRIGIPSTTRPTYRPTSAYPPAPPPVLCPPASAVLAMSLLSLFFSLGAPPIPSFEFTSGMHSSTRSGPLATSSRVKRPALPETLGQTQRETRRPVEARLISTWSRAPPSGATPRRARRGRPSPAAPGRPRRPAPAGSARRPARSGRRCRASARARRRHRISLGEK